MSEDTEQPKEDEAPTFKAGDWIRFKGSVINEWPRLLVIRAPNEEGSCYCAYYAEGKFDYVWVESSAMELAPIAEYMQFASVKLP